MALIKIYNTNDYDKFDFWVSTWWRHGGSGWEPLSRNSFEMRDVIFERPLKHVLFAFSSLVAEFDLWLRVNIGCILDFETEIAEAADVLFAIDELNAAINLRIGLEEEEADEDTTEEDYNSGLILLCFLTSENLLCIQFAGQNHLVQHFHIFFHHKL